MSSAAEINGKIQWVHDRVRNTSLWPLDEDVRFSRLTLELLSILNFATGFEAVADRLDHTHGTAHGISTRTASLGAELKSVTEGSTRQEITDAQVSIAAMAASAEAVGTHTNTMHDKLQSALGHLAAFKTEMEEYVANHEGATARLEQCHQNQANAVQSLESFMGNPL